MPVDPVFEELKYKYDTLSYKRGFSELLKHVYMITRQHLFVILQ